jgi:hypothetical protein
MVKTPFDLRKNTTNLMPPVQHKDRLRYIRERLKDERFPVAALARNTCEDKGNCSKIWNGKKPISEAFWQKFIAHYGSKPIKIAEEHVIIQKLDEILKILKADKR